MARIDPRLLEAARYPLRIEITTRFADMDRQQHINNVAIAEAFEDARVRLHDQARVYDSFGRLGSVVGAHYIDYLAEAHYPDLLVLHIGAMAIGRTSWTLGSIATQSGRVCAFSKAVMVAARDGRAEPFPDAARQALTPYLIKLD
ncbi:MAG: thioesterase family protein [Sphingobium sp.]